MYRVSACVFQSAINIEKLYNRMIIPSSPWPPMCGDIKRWQPASRSIVVVAMIEEALPVVFGSRLEIIPTNSES